MRTTTQTQPVQATSLKKLNETDLRALAPAIFAKDAAKTVSSRYTFVSTQETLPILADHGFVPIAARQRRDAGIHGHHRIDLMHQDHLDKMIVGKAEGAPRIILENSHDRSRRLIMMAGYYRLVCSNGMVVASGLNAMLRAQHVSLNVEGIREMIKNMAAMLDASQQRVEAFRARKLSPIEQSTLARYALEARYKGYAEIPVEAKEVLHARRDVDKGDDLWTVFNRIQENVVKGGLVTHEGRRTRGVTSFYHDVVVNRRLWEGAEALLAGGTQGLGALRKALRAEKA